MSQFHVTVYPSNVCVLELMVGSLDTNDSGFMSLFISPMCFGMYGLDFGSK